MLFHVVAYRLTDSAAVERAVALLRSLEGEVDELRDLEVGANVLPSARAFDLCLVAQFESVEDLRRYQENPFHQEVAGELRKLVAESMSVDFLSDDEMLSTGLGGDERGIDRDR